jgi:hypothetical protein
MMSWPVFDRTPAAAFVDVDGTLLAQTTTFFAHSTTGSSTASGGSITAD